MLFRSSDLKPVSDREYVSLNTSGKGEEESAPAKEESSDDSDEEEEAPAKEDQ